MWAFSSEKGTQIKNRVDVVSICGIQKKGKKWKPTVEITAASLKRGRIKMGAAKFGYIPQKGPQKEFF